MNVQLSKEVVEALGNISEEQYSTLKKIVEIFPLSCVSNGPSENENSEVKEDGKEEDEELVDAKAVRRKKEAEKRKKMVIKRKKADEEELSVREYENRVGLSKGMAVGVNLFNDFGHIHLYRSDVRM